MAEKDSGVKLCMLVRLLPGMGFCHFGELWLTWSNGGGHYFQDVRINSLVPSGGSRRGSVGSRNWVLWLGGAVGIGGCGIT